MKKLKEYNLVSEALKKRNFRKMIKKKKKTFLSFDVNQNRNNQDVNTKNGET